MILDPPVDLMDLTNEDFNSIQFGKGEITRGLSEPFHNYMYVDKPLQKSRPERKLGTLPDDMGLVYEYRRYADGSVILYVKKDGKAIKLPDGISWQVSGRTLCKP